MVLKSVFWALVMLFIIGVTYMFQTKTEQVVIQPSDCNKNTNTSQNTTSQPQIKDELDKKIPTSELIQIRDILNSFDFRKAFTYNARNLLIKRLLQVESSQFTNEHASEIKKLDLEFAKQFFLDLKKVLNSKKLKQSEYITSREIFPEVMPAEELEYLVSKINSDNEYAYTENNYYDANNYNNEVEEDDEIEDMLIGTSDAETYTSYKSNKKERNMFINLIKNMSLNVDTIQIGTKMTGSLIDIETMKKNTMKQENMNSKNVIVLMIPICHQMKEKMRICFRFLKMSVYIVTSIQPTNLVLNFQIFVSLNLW